MKRTTLVSLHSLLAAACLAAALLLANNSRASISYFDVNGTTAGYGVANGGTYNWDDPNWATTSGGTAATGSYTPTSFAWFHSGTASYTVTAASDESMAGLYLNDGGTTTLTINGTGFGAMDISTSGGDGVNNFDGSFYQGFLCSYSSGSSSVIINAPVTGSGGIEQEGYGNLYLNGVNTYTGGTETTGGQNTYYNNNSSFGTGHIVINGGGQAFVNNSSSAVTIANPVVFVNVGDDVILASGNGGTTFSGGITLAASGANTINTTSTASTKNKVTGVISGAGGLTVTGAGTLELAAVNTYTGTTTLSGPGTVKLSVANAIASSSSVVLAGGVLDLGGLSHSMTATTLGLTANSTLLMNGGSSVFANSSALSWSGVLDLADWNPSVDSITIGTDATGLTAGQLADIEFNNNPATLGTAYLTATGVVVPEPSTNALAIIGGLGCLGMAWRARRAKS